MKTVKPITRTENVTTVTCDVCGAPATKGCIICGDDICFRHFIWSDSEYDDPIFGQSGDHPPNFCLT